MQRSNFSIGLSTDGGIDIWGNVSTKNQEINTFQGVRDVDVYEDQVGILFLDGRVWSNQSGFQDSVPFIKAFNMRNNAFIGLKENGEVLWWDRNDTYPTVIEGLIGAIDVTSGYVLTSEGEINKIQIADGPNGVTGTFITVFDSLKNVVDIESNGSDLIALHNNGMVSSYMLGKDCNAQMPRGLTNVKKIQLIKSGNQGTVAFAFGGSYFDEQIPKRYIKGKVYNDINENCVFDGGDQAYKNSVVVLRPDNIYSNTDSTGSYRIPVSDVAGSYTVERLKNTQAVFLSESNCVNAYTLDLPAGNGDYCCLDFGVTEVGCSALNVEVATGNKRLCFKGKTSVAYKNLGDIDSESAILTVEYPLNVIPVTSMPAWDSQEGNILTYNLGKIKAKKGGVISIVDSAACQIRHLRTAGCIQASIQPNQTCKLPPIGWDNVAIGLSKNCTNGIVKFEIVNQTVYDMQDSVEARVSVNDTLVSKNKVKLKANNQTVIEVSAFGSTAKLEVDQTKQYPHADSLLVEVVEGCISSLQTDHNVVKGVALSKSLGFKDIDQDLACFTITGSYDPNDKQAVPVGLTDAHYVLAGTSIDYTIRFQNTGTDTAFKVVLVDTLDSSLDISTFMQGASSHPYSLKVSGKGNPILTFTFNNILLPDSNVNVLASNGFVSFKINTFSNLSDETIIKNEAAIYFDYNSPVITNTVYHTIGEPKWEDFSRGNLVTIGDPKPLETANSLAVKQSMVYPNPTTGTIYLQGADEGDSFEIQSLLGASVYKTKIANETSFSIQDLPKGIYFYQIHRNGKTVDTGKLIRE